MKPRLKTAPVHHRRTLVTTITPFANVTNVANVASMSSFLVSGAEIVLPLSHEIDRLAAQSTKDLQNIQIHGAQRGNVHVYLLLLYHDFVFRKWCVISGAHCRCPGSPTPGGPGGVPSHPSCQGITAQSEPIPRPAQAAAQFSTSLNPCRCSDVLI